MLTDTTRGGVMPIATASVTTGVSNILLASPGSLTPEAQSLLDAVIKSVLDWATQQGNSNRDSNSLGGIRSPFTISQPLELIVAKPRTEAPKREGVDMSAHPFHRFVADSPLLPRNLPVAVLLHKRVFLGFRLIPRGDLDIGGGR